MSIPSHLKGYEELYTQDPRGASLRWFQDAKFGLFVHYTLASLLPHGKPELLELVSDAPHLMNFMEAAPEELAEMDIPDADRERCMEIKRDMMSRFTAENFDADAICDLVEFAQMRYVTFTTKHLMGLLMYKNSFTEYSSVHTAAGRDLVDEIVGACQKRGIGCFLYVPPEFAITTDPLYERNHILLRELLTNYGPVAGVWFDGIGKFYNNPENYTRLSETFALVRELQPHALISFKEGAIGEEDFISPEHFHLPKSVDWQDEKRQAQWEMRLGRWKKNDESRHHLFADKPVEINSTMQVCKNRDGEGEPGGWVNDESARHLNVDEVWFLLSVARSQGTNFLMNIGPRGDGSIHPDDNQALRAVGERIRVEDFPK